MKTVNKKMRDDLRKSRKNILLLSLLFLASCASSENKSSGRQAAKSQDAALAQSMQGIGAAPIAPVSSNGGLDSNAFSQNFQQGMKDRQAADQAFQEKQMARNQAFQDKLSKDSKQQNALDFAQNTATLLTLISATKMLTSDDDCAEANFDKKKFKDIDAIVKRAGAS